MIFRNKLWDILYSFTVYPKWDSFFFNFSQAFKTLDLEKRVKGKQRQNHNRNQNEANKTANLVFFHACQLNHIDFLHWSDQPYFCAIHTNYNLILGKMLIKAGIAFSMFHCLAIIHICYLFLVLVKWLSGKRDSFLVEGQANIHQALLCESRERCGFKEENKEYFFMGAPMDFM